MPRREIRDGDMSDRIDIKVFILFLLDELRYPLNETVIAEMVHEHGYVGRFDFAECFSELCEHGHVVSDDVDGVSYYVISNTGKSVVAELFNQFRQELALACDNHAVAVDIAVTDCLGKQNSKRAFA